MRVLALLLDIMMGAEGIVTHTVPQGKTPGRLSPERFAPVARSGARNGRTK